MRRHLAKKFTDLPDFRPLRIQMLRSDTKEELWRTFDEIKNKYVPGDSSGKGQRALFVITTPTEDVLEYTLKHCGFEEVHQFPRRNGYPEGLLKMFIKNL